VNAWHGASVSEFSLLYLWMYNLCCSTVSLCSALSAATLPNFWSLWQWLQSCIPPNFVLQSTALLITNL